MNKTPPSCRSEKADCYIVRNSGEWARIFLIGGQREMHDGSGNHWWGTITVNSSFGSWGHTFSSMDRPLEEFLSSLDMHYLMGKFMGGALRGFDQEATSKELRRKVCRWRRRQLESPPHLRELYDEIVELDGDIHSDSNTYFTVLRERAGTLFYKRELWESERTSVNPQAEGFWKEIWPSFIEHLKERVPA